MDKSYTLMYELDKKGVIATTSPLSKLTNTKTLEASLQLPLPNKNKVIQISETEDNVTSVINSILIKYNVKDATGNINPDLIIGNLNSSNADAQVAALKILGEIISAVDNIENPVITNDNSLIKALNKHNSYKVSEAALRNVVTNAVYHCATDVANFEESQQPMDSGEFNDILARIETRSGKGSAKYNNANPYTKFAIQFENSVGKRNVGIAANGIKADAALQQYYNEGYANWDGHSDLGYYKFDMSLSFSQNTTVDGITTTREIYADHLTHIGDVVFDQNEEVAKAKFKQLYTNVTDLTETSLYKDLVALSQGLSERSGVSFNEPEYVQLKNIIESYKKRYKKSYAEILATKDSYLDFLWYKRKFNHNVADSISVMISLATD